MVMPKIPVIHGPTLTLLRRRDHQHSGRAALTAIDRRLADQAMGTGVTLTAFRGKAEATITDGFMRRKAAKRATSSSIRRLSRTPEAALRATSAQAAS